MKIFLGVLAVIVIIGLVLGGGLISNRNELVTEKNGVEAAWAQVDVVLQRRADLIPNLVETVKGFAKQEQSVIDSVTQARAAMMGAKSPSEKIAADGQISSALGRLFVMVESYPNLKSDQNFLRLQDELTGTENRIAQERRKYNEIVQRYNTDIDIFPTSIAASMFNFQREDACFKAENSAKEAPKVKF